MYECRRLQPILIPESIFDSKVSDGRRFRRNPSLNCERLLRFLQRIRRFPRFSEKCCQMVSL